MTHDSIELLIINIIDPRQSTKILSGKIGSFFLGRDISEWRVFLLDEDSYGDTNLVMFELTCADAITIMSDFDDFIYEGSW